MTDEHAHKETSQLSKSARRGGEAEEEAEFEAAWILQLKERTGIR